MNSKAAPLLLVMAALTIAATALLTTRESAPPIPAGKEGGPVPAESAAVADVPMTGSTAPPAESVSPRPAAVEPTVAFSSAASSMASGGGNAAAAPARERRQSQLGEVTEPARPGNIQAEMAVSQALATAGLSTADIQVATLGSAPAAATAMERPETATEETATPANRDLNIPVPTGAKVPVVFYDNQARPIPQQQALDRIAGEFNEIISNPPTGYTQAEVWEAARKLADERYTVLYGFEAFNQMSMQAAREALREKKAVTAAGQKTTP
jgi:hypothetical protein